MQLTKRLLLMLLFLLVSGYSLHAEAETKKNLKYPYDWVYNSAVRLLKVDLKCDMEEENEKSGYILFWYEYNGIKSYATMEIVDITNDNNGYGVHVRLVLEKLPSWVEEDIVEKLESKIKDQYGNPPKYEKKKKEEDKEKKDEENKGDTSKDKKDD